jgi:hypothetical protein
MLIYFMAIWNILRTFGKFYDHLVIKSMYECTGEFSLFEHNITVVFLDECLKFVTQNSTWVVSLALDRNS